MTPTFLAKVALPWSGAPMLLILFRPWFCASWLHFFVHNSYVSTHKQRKTTSGERRKQPQTKVNAVADTSCCISKLRKQKDTWVYILSVSKNVCKLLYKGPQHLSSICQRLLKAMSLTRGALEPGPWLSTPEHQTHQPQGTSLYSQAGSESQRSGKQNTDFRNAVFVFHDTLP